ncbi:MAG: hypothetical protein KME23_14150 [Goleter apudmare HA4340-LM2]|jgi:hypothetical protein|nr:hypothetical protein [Goleter apudmare HA4340-LM2]
MSVELLVINIPHHCLHQKLSIRTPQWYESVALAELSVGLYKNYQFSAAHDTSHHSHQYL